MLRECQKGVTLIELVVVAVLLGILLSIASPTLTSLLETRRLAGAVDVVRSHLTHARSQAIKQMATMSVTYTAGDSSLWRIGTRPESACDPELIDPWQANACAIDVGGTLALMVLDGTGYPGITLATNRTMTRFDPIRGTAFGTNATIRLLSSTGREVRIIVSNVGRIRTCSPSGQSKVSGFPSC